MILYCFFLFLKKYFYLFKSFYFIFNIFFLLIHNISFFLFETPLGFLCRISTRNFRNNIDMVKLLLNHPEIDVNKETIVISSHIYDILIFFLTDFVLNLKHFIF